jgi:hypothetical protein
LLSSGRFFRVGGASSGDSGEQALFATMQAAETFVNTVPTADRPAWRTQVLTFLNGRPDIGIAGETPDGVWAVTTDGLPLAFWNNRLPDPFDPLDEQVQQIQMLGAQTPGNIAARFATTVGSGYRLAGPRLSRQLSKQGYAASFDSAPLDSLKGRRNESVFFFNTHGGAFEMARFDAAGTLLRGADGNLIVDPMYGLWSGTKFDKNSTNDFAVFISEAKAKRVTLALQPVSYMKDAAGNQTAVNEWHFAITGEWVRHYMTFPQQNHASIWLGACRSGSADAAPMRSAFRAAGAEMVSSWTQNVTGDAVLSATSFLYDRLLGANDVDVQPPETPQRPFDYENCWIELRSKGLHKHPTVDEKGAAAVTEIVYEGATGDDAFGVFAPSLQSVFIEEVSEQAYLIGIFGKPPAEDQHVTIGGAEAPIVTWEARKIVCSLRLSGDGSAGDVQVIVHGLKSNVRRISRWTVNATYKMTEPDTSHVVNGTLKLIFRADVGEYRKVPGNVFIRPTRYAIAAQSSEIRLEASGVVTFPCGEGAVETDTWVGSGLFPAWDPTGPQVTIANISLDTIDGAGSLGLAFGMADPDQFSLREKVVPCDGASSNDPLAPEPAGPIGVEPLLFRSPLDEILPEASRYELPLPGGVFVFGSDWAISAGRADSEFDSGMTWNGAAAEFAPDPKAAR